MTSVTITRRFAAAPAQVWHAFTDPGALASWFWPHLDNVVQLDPRPGGRYRITAAKAQLAIVGEYLVVQPPTRLVFTWQWDGADEVSRVSITLTADGDDTVLSLVHDRHASDTSRDNHAAGWRDCLDRLPHALAAHPATVPFPHAAGN